MADPARRRFISGDFSHSSDSQESDAAEEAHTAPAARPNLSEPPPVETLVYSGGVWPPVVSEPPPVETLVYSGGAWPPATPSLSAPVRMTTTAAHSHAPKRKFSDAEIADFRHAAARGKMDIVKAFVEAGMPVDAVGTGYGSHVPGYAIAVAAEGGQLSVAKYLVERGASEEARKAAFSAAIVNLHTAKHGGPSANSLAIADGRELAKTLLLGIPEGSARDAAVANTSKKLSALYSATLNEVLRAISFDSLLPRFHQAARNGNLEEVQACIAEGVHVDARERPDFPAALTQAARKGHVDVVEYLLSMKPRPEDRREALTAVAFELVITSEEAAKNRLIEAAKRILHSTLMPAQLKDALSNRLQQQGDHGAADALRSIRV